MRTRYVRLHAARASRRGAALLLSLLTLLVLVAIVIQINVSTLTMAKVTRNDITITTMDAAIESALLQEMEVLKNDTADTSSAAGAPAGAGTTPPTAGAPAAGGAQP